jgi:hypothetical protein
MLSLFKHILITLTTFICVLNSIRIFYSTSLLTELQDFSPVSDAEYVISS